MTQDAIEVPVGGWLVKVTYFRASGKYYTEAEYRSKADSMNAIWDELEKMLDSKAPGLARYGTSFHTLVEVPGHPHDHPRLIPATEPE